MSSLNNQLELLSPAKDIEIARAAILHGADAVYIGGPGFGARHNAGNSLKDIAELVQFAHHFYVKVFVTLNTILHDDELDAVQKLIYQLYNAGVDALIVQDMGILQLDIPPIDLHASTQTDIRTVEKAKFLSDVGFSQLVLARELNLKEITEISQAVDANIEFFIHGALCVAFSGQCYISHAQTGRSANRGDCSQACRLPYTLKDDQGRVIAYDKHLLSMKDNNQSANLLPLIQAGVRSFKIEGRYKDISYVKNITASYRQQLDAILEQHPELSRASSGRTDHHFMPNPEKTFHRGSTDYFVNARKIDIGAFDSPKFLGLPVGEIIKTSTNYLDISSSEPLHNGDGLSVLVKRETVGFRVNNVEKLAEQRYRVFPNEMLPELLTLKAGLKVNRNLDHVWQQSLLKESANRKVAIKFYLTENEHGLVLQATSEEGVIVQTTLAGTFECANQPKKSLATLKEGLAKLGQTIYYADDVMVDLSTIYFVPAAQLNQLRRQTVEALTEERLTQYSRVERKPISEPPPVYPQKHLTFLANIYNQKAREFYQRFGVTLIDDAYEAHHEEGDVPLMITKHCLRFAFNLCPKQAKGVQGVKTRVTPMKLVHNNETLILEFDCKACEMQVRGKIKPHILKQPSPGKMIDIKTIY